MDKNSLSEILEDPPQLKPRKVLIVVGRMGHGKSAFVNTLILPSISQWPISKVPDNFKHQMVSQRASLESVTTQCCIRQANPKHQLLADPDEKLFIIDTPGLDSESAPCLVSEQIDNIIMEQRCDIVGIAYVINLADREVGGHGQSRLKEFLKVMKMKKEIKNELIFFVLSKWDCLTITIKKQDLPNLENQFYSLLKKIGISNIENKVIRWVNQRSVQPQNLEYFQTVKKGAEIIKNQWQLLRSNIQKVQKNSYSLHTHKKNTQLFWQHLKNQILSQMAHKNIKYNKEPTRIYYNMDIKLREWDIVVDRGNVINVLLKIPIVNIIFLFYSIGSWVMNRDRKMAEGVQNVPEKGLKQFDKLLRSQLVDQISSKIKSILIISLLKKIEVQEDRLIFDSIGKSMKLHKLLTYYQSQYVFKDLASNHKLKVPVAFLHEKDLEERMQIKFEFSRGQEQKAMLHEQSIVEKFRKKEVDVKTRIPKDLKFYVRNNQQIFTLWLKIFCRLPQQSCYCSLIREICVKIFGDYP